MCQSQEEFDASVLNPSGVEIRLPFWAFGGRIAFSRETGKPENAEYANRCLS